MRILLVEDDPMIGEALKLALIDASYAVQWERDGWTAARLLELEEFDLVLLDLGLPSKDGIEVLRTARGNTAKAIDVPVVIVTARDAIDERIKGLDEGADDYILKPFAVEELLARLRVVIRRRSGTASVVIGTDAVSLNLSSKEAQARGVNHRLSNREFALLQALLQRPGAILSRADLEGRVYGAEGQVESNAIEYIIHGLRKKLGQESINNVRGLGWFVSKDGI